MDNSCIISIIIPVFNMAEYLDQSIASWTNQTMKEIEIILVDDASTDKSPAIIKKWKENDGRIRTYTFTKNKSAWSARLLGVREARGQYIMFADADDTVDPDTCSLLYHELQKAPVDILQFRTNLINVNNLPETRIAPFEHFLMPYKGTLQGQDVLIKCFRDGLYGFTLWNKIFSARLCKEAFSDQEDAILPRGQDRLAYFIFAYYAKSYRGYMGRPLYNYHFGRGGSGYETITERRFEQICSMASVVDKLNVFLRQVKKEKEYSDIEKVFRTEFLNECIYNWIHHVSGEDKARYFDILVKYWPPEDVIGFIAKDKSIEKFRLAKQLKKAACIRRNPRYIKTIATYYNSTTNGGVERAMSGLCKIWLDRGYRVILLSEMEASDQDYVFPTEVKRVLLPGGSWIDEEQVLSRTTLWKQIIKENAIDLVVYHRWTFKMMLWDELAIKLAGAAFVEHCHGVFSTELAAPSIGLSNIVAPSLIADAVVTLSEVDRRFWSHFNPNVFTVINPFTDELMDWKQSDCSGNDILWVGRISAEKQPFDALMILQNVLRTIPDAKLHIVGSARDANFEQKFKRAIREMGLQDHVVLHGYQTDVMPYYEKGSLFLMTSEFEGYALVLQESMTAGLPVVMYELPHLTLVQDNPGIVAVPQKDTEEAARVIVNLLKDDEKRKQLGRASRGYIMTLRDYDFSGKWNEIFNSVMEAHPQKLSESDIVMMETLIKHSSAGFQKNQDGLRYAGRKTVKTAVHILKIKDSINEYGLKVTLKKELKAFRGH